MAASENLPPPDYDPILDRDLNILGKNSNIVSLFDDELRS